MKKILFLLTLMIGSLLSFSQNLPTLLSYEIDTMCSYDNSFNVVHTIQVEDLDADNTYIFIDSYSPGSFVSVIVDNPTFVPGEQIRTFTITATPSTGLSPGLNLSDIEISIYGNFTNDLGYTDTTISNVAVYGNINVSFDISSISLCENAQPIDLRPYASPAGGHFKWGSETGYMFDPELYLTGGSGLYYYYSNTAGCSSYAFSADPTFLTYPSININEVPSTCGNSDGEALPGIFGGVPPYTIYWSNGFSETVFSTPTTVTGLKAGNYYMNVTDANNCKGVALAQISDSDISITPTIINETCLNSSQDGGIDLSISSGTGTVNYTHWSNGQQTTNLTNVHKGEYTVEIRTDNGCEANETYFVSVNSGHYMYNINSTDAFCSNSNGVIDYEVSGGIGPFEYSWNTGATTQDLFGVPSGTYTCLVTDMGTGCSITYKHDVASSSGPSAFLNNLTQPTCGNADGSIDLAVYSGGSPITATVWSSGHTKKRISGLAAGNYEITVTALDGCKLKHTITLENALPEKPEICMLTVDTSLVYNQIVWEKDLSQPSIAGYNIYRETSSYSNFQLIDTRPYALESFYQDNDASPVDHSWRYAITAYDDCGNESQRSLIHKTIHVVANTSDMINYVVSWDNYEGMNYSSVDVLRFDDTNGWVVIGDDIPYGNNSQSDAPTVTSGLDYLVTFNLSAPCTSSKAQDYNSSRSNKTASVFNAGGSTMDIEDVELGTISVYPNPTSDFTILYLDKPELFQNYEIMTLNGQTVSSGLIFGNKTEISTEMLSNGIYLIRIVSAEKTIMQKLVKN